MTDRVKCSKIKITNLDHALVQAIDDLDRFGVCKRENIGAKPDNVTVFPVQLYDGPLMLPP